MNLPLYIARHLYHSDTEGHVSRPAVRIAMLGVAAADSGTAGSLTWSLNDQGVLTISGNGDMPDYEDIYFKDKIMVTGHTPTAFIDEAYRGRIWKGNNHIALDCGAVFGNPLGCICLDTMEEIYADEKNIMRIGMKDR